MGAGGRSLRLLLRHAMGQTSPDFLETSLYQRNGAKWSPRKLANPVEAVLDAGDHGNTYVEAVTDSGCCGWSNESDDMTRAVRGETATVFFDERRRFHNDNYDVSFYTGKAALSPDLTRVAHTIVAGAPAGQEIRLSSEGKENPDELKAIRQALAEMPRVEVVALEKPGQVSLALPNCELVGWIDGGRLLVLNNGELQSVDLNSGKAVLTGIKADAAKYVFLR